MGVVTRVKEFLFPSIPKAEYVTRKDVSLDLTGQSNAVNGMRVQINAFLSMLNERMEAFDAISECPDAQKAWVTGGNDPVLKLAMELKTEIDKFTRLLNG